MADIDPRCPRSKPSGSLLVGTLLATALTMTPHAARAATQARLVHCGNDTCLRLSGHRSNRDVAIRIAGHDLPVEGQKLWHATLSLPMARNWADASGATMMLTLADKGSGRQGSELVTLPPGALGRRVALASLMVRAR